MRKINAKTIVQPWKYIKLKKPGSVENDTDTKMRSQKKQENRQKHK